jgi:integrase
VSPAGGLTEGEPFMARSINRLTDRTVKSVTKPGRHGDGGNLFLIVDPPRTAADGSTPKPSKRWAFIFRWDGKLREMGLGSLNALSLADARDIATTYRGLLARKLNPLEVRREEERRLAEEQAKRAAGRTFGEVAKAYHAAHESSWKNAKVRKQWLPRLETYCGGIWAKSVETITTEDVLAALNPIWNVKSETARIVRGRIEAVLDAARARGLIDKDKANPAAWRGHLAHLLPKSPKLQRGHHKALPYTEIASFMAHLRAREAMAALALEFAILTGGRTSEALECPWGEIDLEAKLWLIPRERMKSEREHRVPLSGRCLEILRKLEPMKAGADSYVFPGTKPGRPLSSMSMLMLLRRMKVTVTVHGFRSTFRDWAGDCTSFAREIAEMSVAHLVGNDAERAYRRGDAIEKRRQLMQAWADHCAGESNVVALRPAG